jgi:ribosomal protein L21
VRPTGILIESERKTECLTDKRDIVRATQIETHREKGRVIEKFRTSGRQKGHRQNYTNKDPQRER